jgi:hypothetical protein
MYIIGPIIFENQRIIIFQHLGEHLQTVDMNFRLYIKEHRRLFVRYLMVFN